MENDTDNKSFIAKRHKLMGALLGMAVTLVVFYGLASWTLAMNRLTFMNGVNYSVFAVVVCLSLAITALLICSMFRKATRKQEKWSSRILCGVGGVLLILGFLFVIFVGSLLSVFTYKPEHVVDKDGVTMVAHVDSFVQVNVYYYEYVNPIVRGCQKRISEDYGNGGYDPFEWDKMPKVKYYIYYDEDGNITDSNWL